MEDAASELMRMRACRRRFILLADGGVRIRWECGAEKEVADEPAIDVEFLADHLPRDHHHRLHLPHHKQGAR